MITINKKGQIFTWDLIVSLAIFLVILGLLTYLWNTSLWNVSYSENMYELSWLANTVAEQLIRTTGFPENWHLVPETLVVLGLKHSDEFNYSQDRVLDAGKFLQFVNLTYANYTAIRNKLLSTGKYDFYLEVNCLDITENCLEGIYADTPSDAVINCTNNANLTIVNHLMALNGEPRCIIGEYATPSSSVMMGVEKRTATFKNKMNATIALTLVIWIGETAPISAITVVTTTTTPSATTTTTIIPTGPELQCYYDTSCDSDQCVLSMDSDYGDLSGAHIGDCSIYTDKICCKVVGATCTLSCNSGSGDCILRVGSDYTTAAGDHLQDCTMSDFATQIQCSADCGTFTCEYRDACNSDENCVASMGSDYITAAGDHIGGCSTYTKKICCKIAT